MIYGRQPPTSPLLVLKPLNSMCNIMHGKGVAYSRTAPPPAARHRHRCCLPSAGTRTQQQWAPNALDTPTQTVATPLAVLPPEVLQSPSATLDCVMTIRRLLFCFGVPGAEYGRSVCFGPKRGVVHKPNAQQPHRRKSRRLQPQFGIWLVGGTVHTKQLSGPVRAGAAASAGRGRPPGLRVATGGCCLSAAPHASLCVARARRGPAAQHSCIQAALRGRGWARGPPSVACSGGCC